MKRTIMVTGCAAVVAAATFACASGDGEQSGETSADAGVLDTAPQVEVLTVEPRRFFDRIEVTGTTEAIHDATLSAQSAGTVQDLVVLGARVKKGRVLARLDTGVVEAQVRQARASVEAARASAELAEESYERQKPLYEDEIISALEFRKIRSELASAKAQLAQAEASLAQAKESLSNTRVVAPFDGVVEVRMVKEGEQVTPGMPILRVTDSSVMKVKAGVPERYAAFIEVGSSVQVRFNAYGVSPRSGKLRFVSSVIDPDSRTFEVEAELDNGDRALKPEMVAKVMITKAVIDDALVVPRTSVIRDETGNSLFVVEQIDGQTVAQLRTVRLGAASGGEVVIEEGLSPGDEVIVLGQSDLTRGDRVRITRRRDAAMRNGIGPPTER